MNNKYLRLGVNIDHVATIRNARGGIHPDPLKAAHVAYQAGADGITAHLREDRRHISDKDIARLIEDIGLPLNLEMAPTIEMLNIAIKHKPHACCLVPEKRQEVTTEGGLDIDSHYDRIKNCIEKLKENEIRVSLFIDPNKKYIEFSADFKHVGADVRQHIAQKHLLAILGRQARSTRHMIVGLQRRWTPPIEISGR